MKELKIGMLKVGLGRYSQVFTDIGLTVIMARLLSPEEFGVVAGIVVFYSFALIPIGLGLGPAVIRDRGLTREELSGMYYMTGLSSGLMSVLFYLGSRYILPGFYGSDIYPELGIWFSLAIIFGGLNTVPRGMLLRDKKFGSLAVIDLVVNIASGIFSIYLVIKGYSYSGIAIRYMLLKGLSLIIDMTAAGLKPSPRPNLEGYRRNKSYSRNQLHFNTLNYFSRNLDNILIGRYLGMGALGYYEKSYKLMLYPVKNLSSVVGPVLQPIMSSIEDKEKILSEYIKVVKVLTLSGFAISAFLYHTSYEVVEIFYGDGWLKTAEIFKILSLAVGIQVIMSSSGAIFQATGRTDLLLKAGIFSAVTNVMAIAGGIALNSLIHIGSLLTVSFTINFIQCYYLMMKIFNKNLRYFLGEITPSLIYGLGIFVVLGRLPIIEGSTMVSFLYKGGLSLGTIVFIYIFSKKVRRRVW